MKIKIEIKVELNSRAYQTDLHDASITTLKSHFPDIQLESLEIEEGIGFTDSTLVTYILSFGASVASGVVANAVCTLIAKSAHRIFVGRRRVKPDLESLQQAIETEIISAVAEVRESSEEDVNN